MSRKELATQITESLFTNGAGEKGVRLVIEGRTTRDIGGWGFDQVVAVIERHIEARFAAQPDNIARRLWKKVNEWRCRLIEWEHAGDMSPRDLAELAELQALADEALRVLAPLPIAELEAYMRGKGVDVPTAPDVLAQASYHSRIMNIPCAPGTGDIQANSPESSYLRGHRDARHAAAEIANEADARIHELEAQLAEADDLARSLGHRLSEREKRWQTRAEKAEAQFAGKEAAETYYIELQEVEKSQARIRELEAQLVEIERWRAAWCEKYAIDATLWPSTAAKLQREANDRIAELEAQLAEAQAKTAAAQEAFGYFTNPGREALEAQLAAAKDAADAYYIELQEAEKSQARIRELEAQLAGKEAALAGANEKMNRAEKVYEEQSQLMTKDWRMRIDYLFDTEQRAEKAEAQLAEAQRAADGFKKCYEDALAGNRAILTRKAMLRDALEAVEWEYDEYRGLVCPWCDGANMAGHKPDCAREAALNPQKGEG